MRNKKFSRRDLLKGASASTLGAVFAAPLTAAPLSAAPAPSTVDPALIAAARREGSLAFYTAMSIPIAQALAARFEAKYPGIKVRIKRSGAERVFQRIGEEEEIRIHEVDVVCSTDAGHFVRWKRDGLLAPYVPEDAARNFPPEQIDADGMHATAFALLSPIGYNANLVKPEEAPKSFADLLDPRWKGKIVKGRPDYSGTVFTATFQIARDLGWSYFEQLALQQVTQVQSASETLVKLAAGAAAVAADGPESDLLLLKQRHAPVEPVYPSEGTPLVIAPSAVFRTAPSPNAARLFQSFVFSAEGQEILVRASAVCSFHALVPERPGRHSLSSIKLMQSDPAAMEGQREEIQARYSRIFGQG
jgi:iron(III) transport system substrate-binding protein